MKNRDSTAQVGREGYSEDLPRHDLHSKECDMVCSIELSMDRPGLPACSNDWPGDKARV